MTSEEIPRERDRFRGHLERDAADVTAIRTDGALCHLTVPGGFR